jgi:hypothetical protein
MKSIKKTRKPLRKLSKHKPKKKKFYADKTLLGHYLAGLIDGGGHFSTVGHCVICFSNKDVSFARELRTEIGFGTVRKIKDKKAFNLIISNSAGVVFVADLVRDKLKHPGRIKQFNERLTSWYPLNPTSEDTTINWDTPWFSGFFDADGNLGIRLVRCPNRKTVKIRLLAKIDQNQSILLQQIKKRFSGYLGYREAQDTYYYSSISFSNFSEVLQYFDRFSLQSPTKYLSYEYMRKAFLIVQVKEHLTETGFKKIEMYHKRLLEIKDKSMIESQHL